MIVPCWGDTDSDPSFVFVAGKPAHHDPLLQTAHLKCHSTGRENQCIGQGTHSNMSAWVRIEEIE